MQTLRQIMAGPTKTHLPSIRITESIDWIDALPYPQTGPTQSKGITGIHDDEPHIDRRLGHPRRR
jgi:hypothetical protein